MITNGRTEVPSSFCGVVLIFIYITSKHTVVSFAALRFRSFRALVQRASASNERSHNYVNLTYFAFEVVKVFGRPLILKTLWI